MGSKPTGNSKFPFAALAAAAIVVMMGFSAALAMKTQPDAASSGERPDARASATAEPGIAADAKPDDVQTFY